MKTMAGVRWEDWEYDYKHENRFAFMGNGKPQVASLPLAEQLNKMVTYVRKDETPWSIE